MAYFLHVFNQRQYCPNQSSNAMNTKKSPKADLENKRVLFIEIGLVIALSIVLGAFEYKATIEMSV